MVQFPTFKRHRDKDMERVSILVHKCLNNSAPPCLVDKIRRLQQVAAAVIKLV